MKNAKKMIYGLAITGVVTFSSVVAQAAFWSGGYGGYVYNQSLTSEEVSDQDPTYKGIAQTRWDGDGKVSAFVEGVNSRGYKVGGSEAGDYGSYGWAEAITDAINDSSLAYWNSAHKIYDDNWNIENGSQLWHQIER